MLSKLRVLLKYSIRGPTSSFFIFGDRKYSMDKPEVVDINFEDMMYEESDIGSEISDSMLTKEPQLKSTGFDGAPIAPIDINPWLEEEEFKEGTVLEETLEKKQIISELPEPPAERSGVYEFRGIKIVLPKKLLRPATYRYRLDQEDVESLADDIRICKFDK